MLHQAHFKNWIQQNLFLITYWIGFFVFSSISVIALGALGFPLKFTIYNFLKIIYFTIPIFLIFLLLQFWSNRLFLLCFGGYFLLSWLYLPQALMYGSLSYGIIIALFETNPTEVFEYFTTIPWWVYFAFIGYLCFFLLLAFFSRRLPIKNPMLIYRPIWFISLLIVIYYISFAPVKVFIKEQKLILATSRSHIYPIKFTSLFYQITSQYIKVRNYLNDSKLIDTWEILSVQPKYQTYVLIIGESVRRDYLNLYGYPIDNTPFLSQVNGIVFNQYTSTASGTHAALERILYLTNPQKDIIYHNTLMNLAKKANFQTSWLSNQGVLGNADRAASRVAQQADYQYFINQKTFSNTFDDELLPKFDEVLQEKTEKPKLIVLHLMGSHSDFCKRIRQQPSFQLINKDMSCYFESILQTDKLIATINQKLQQQGQPYSVLYFADHGLSHNNTDILRHNKIYKQNYDVPLIQFSSDDTQRTYIQSHKSGFDLINGLAEWLGIQEKTLIQKPSFYLDQPSNQISVYNWEKLVDYDSLKDDPALPPTPYQP